MKKSPFRILFGSDASTDARDEIFEQLRERIAAVARKRVPEEAVCDVVQDTMLVLVQKLSELDVETDVLPYTFIILQKVIGNYYQKRNPNILPLPCLQEEPCVDHEEELDLKIYRDQILDLCMSVNGEYARIVKLVMAGYTASEITRQLDCPSVQALYNKIHRGRRKLKKILETREAAEPIEREAV